MPREAPGLQPKGSVTRHNENLFSAALEEWVGGQKQYLLDALHVELFNIVGDPEGNTAASDPDWLAAVLWAADRRKVVGGYDRQPAEVRERYRELARASLEALPRLMERIASRCRAQARALRSLALHERAEAEWRQGGR